MRGCRIYSRLPFVFLSSFPFYYMNTFFFGSLTPSLQLFFFPHPVPSKWLSFPFLYLLVWKLCSPYVTQVIGLFLNKVSGSALSSAYLSCLLYSCIVEFITHNMEWHRQRLDSVRQASVLTVHSLMGLCQVFWAEQPAFDGIDCLESSLLVVENRGS